jgi:hypothetical protein
MRFSPRENASPSMPITHHPIICAIAHHPIICAIAHHPIICAIVWVLGWWCCYVVGLLLGL